MYLDACMHACVSKPRTFIENIDRASSGRKVLQAMILMLLWSSNVDTLTEVGRWGVVRWNCSSFK